MTKCLLAIASCFLLELVGNLAAATLPSGFSEATVNGPAGAAWNEAVGMHFEDNGRLYVWERGGRVWFQESGASTWTKLIDISEEVGGWRDFGLLGFALDPNFRVNGYIYLMYVVDRHHLIYFGTPSYNSTSNTYYAATIGRITRYTARAADGFASVDYASRRVLLGETKSTGFPILYESHGTGSLVFGTDGTLLASCGDGASYSTVDTGSVSHTYYAQALTDGIIQPKENVGAYRAQLVDSLSGKIVRLNPETGDGIPGNPYYDAANPRSAKSRVWALGLRNPCRMTLRPGTGSHVQADANPGVLYIGDVGYATWEDLNVCTGPGQNFGWPAFEGIDAHSGYSKANVQNLDAPNPLYPGSDCSQYFYFTNLIKQDTTVVANQPPFSNPCNAAQKIPGTIPQFLHRPPVLDWKHGTTSARTWIYNGSGVATAINVGGSGSPVSGSMFPGNCSIGGVWYTGNDFPAKYRNTYFHADYGENWIKYFQFDGDNRPASANGFLTGGGGIVALATHPLNGGLYYLSWATTLRKISFSASGNLPPKAVVSADKNYGSGPLLVQFTGSTSTDPEGQSLTYAWNFGDGTAPSTTANPVHTFNAPGGVPTPYTATLTVTDSVGQTSTAMVLISVNNTPPTVSITSPINGSRFPMTGDTIYSLTATVSDNESSDALLRYEWLTFLHHNNHEHQEPLDTNHVTTTTISPVGCDGINIYYYRITLTVTDPAGLSTTREVKLFPDCGTPDTPPVISHIPDQAILLNQSTSPIVFTVSDAETATANLQVSAVSSNPLLVPTGNIILGDNGLERTVMLTPLAGQTGTATITVNVNDGPNTTSTNFVLRVQPDPPPAVVGRQIFYNHSTWDGNEAAANASDDNAIAPDKTALLPGGVATFANYTSYSRGLNGIMVDITNWVGTPIVSDFTFKVGNDNSPAGWVSAPDPVSLTARPLGGNVTRLTLIWNDNNLDGVVDANEAVTNNWLEVTVLANANTGLGADHVFYFGNAVGESGNSTLDAQVTVPDAFEVVNHLQTSVPIDSQWDHNRNQLVSVQDAFIAVNHLVAGPAALQLIDLSGGGDLVPAAAATTLLLDRSALGLSLTEQASLQSGQTIDSSPILRLLSAERLATGEIRLLVYAASAPAGFQIQYTDTLPAAAWRSVPGENIHRQGERLLEVTLPAQNAAYFRLSAGITEPTILENE